MRPLHAIALLTATGLLAGCGSVSKTLGLDRSSPDEFQVMSQAPLSMPPDYQLRPPKPGAPRPSDGTTAAEARAALFGGSDGAMAAAGPSNGTDALLAKAGAGSGDGEIRNEVDSDHAALVKQNDGLVNDILFWRDGRPPATVVDASAEDQRLRRAKADGQAPTDGDTVSRQEGAGAPLEDLVK